MKKSDFKYIKVYDFYKKLIEDGALKEGDKLPSLLACCKELSVSKTTAENGYFQLAADGYVISKEKSGYYVSGRSHEFTNYNINNKNIQLQGNEKNQGHKLNGEGYLNGTGNVNRIKSIMYDLAQTGDDPDSFDYDLWSRYVKSALRHKDRMATFGNPRGEQDLREAICEYLRKQRSIYCSPDSIIIGASTQGLLMSLLPVLKKNGAATASVPTRGFERYERIFSSYDFKVDIRDKTADVIYVSPSYMTLWGETMPLTRRYEILEHSKKGHLIIEDDYQNELIFSKQKSPSIYALSGGENVVYMGSFSRILMPSIRISFMVLPQQLIGGKEIFYESYDQTASKTEQIALCSYLRDEHIYRQIKRLRKIYGAKKMCLEEIVQMLITDIPNAKMLVGDGGTEVGVRISAKSVEKFRKKLYDMKISYRELSIKQEREENVLLFSCGVADIESLQRLMNELE